MKIKYYSFLAAAGIFTLASACSADDYSLDAVSVTADQLVEGQAFNITPDASNPNVIHLTSNMKGMTPIWVTPQGRSQKADFTIDLPFAGDYEVTFGVMTKGGPVYGNPYKFNVPQNDFGMLSDDIWTNLAGGVDENGNNTPKKWVPMDKSYGVGYGSSPMMYLDPEHVNNDGVENKDLMFGSDNWTPNWDPGFQSWLIPADDPYMNSYMIFGLDAAKGCTLVQKRADEAEITGTFTLNISDAKRPVITFNDGTYAMHNAGMDATCANYTQDIKIIECTPYVLQLATMRTNSEGAWWLVWNFVAADVQDGTVSIPLGPELVEEAAPELPAVGNLAEGLFTVAGADATYIASKVTYHLDEETPYDILQWDGTGTNKWLPEGLYGTLQFPAYDDSFDLTFTRSDYGVELTNSVVDEFKTNFFVSGNTVTFNDEVTLLKSGDAEIAGKEFTVFKCNVDDGLVIGVPYGTDQYGNVNRYLVANLIPEPVGGAVTGPTVIAFDNSALSPYVDNDNGVSLRFDLYNTWAGDRTWPVDISAIKVKKKKVLKITFKLNGVEWNDGAAPVAVLCHNVGAGLWPSADGSGFNDATAVAVNTTPGGETTLVYDNTNGTETVSFAEGCLSVCIQQKGLVATPLNEDGNVDLDVASVEITSITIE